MSFHNPNYDTTDPNQKGGPMNLGDLNFMLKNNQGGLDGKPYQDEESVNLKKDSKIDS
jgi:hypothetical protein